MAHKIAQVDPKIEQEFADSSAEIERRWGLSIQADIDALSAIINREKVEFEARIRIDVIRRKIAYHRDFLAAYERVLDAYMVSTVRNPNVN